MYSGLQSLMKKSQPQVNLMEENIRDLIKLNEGETLDENLLCTICQQLVINPMECEDCQNLFCSKCIYEWVNKRNACPLNCPSNPVKLKQPHRFVKNALAALRFKCRNHANGCASIIPMDSVATHVKECQFESVKCKNEQCSFIGLRKTLEDHYLECDYEEAKCQKCGFSLLRSTIGLHDCIQELTKRIHSLETRDVQTSECLKQAMQKIQQLEQELHEVKATLKSSIQPKPHVCSKNHVLTFLRSEYGKCTDCKRLNLLTRYKCTACDTAYCQKCKVPVVINNACPNGHKLEFQKGPIPDTLSCDFCGCRPGITGKGNYRDVQCDFDICTDCYKKV